MAKYSEELSSKESYQHNEEWRKNIITSSHMFANDAIKALMLLNGGALVALPALKSLSTDVTISTLFPAVVCFMIGVTTALLSAILAYASLTALAISYRDISNSWEYDLVQKATTDIEIRRQNIDKIRKNNSSSDRWYNIAFSAEIIAVVTAIISLIAFIAGGYQGIVAFYTFPNI